MFAIPDEVGGIFAFQVRAGGTITFLPPTITALLPAFFAFHAGFIVPLSD
jgi:hypothetical protein